MKSKERFSIQCLITLDVTSLVPRDIVPSMVAFIHDGERSKWDSEATSQSWALFLEHGVFYAVVTRLLRNHPYSLFISFVQLVMFFGFFFLDDVSSLHLITLVLALTH